METKNYEEIVSESVKKNGDVESCAGCGEIDGSVGGLREGFCEACFSDAKRQRLDDEIEHAEEALAWEPTREEMQAYDDQSAERPPEGVKYVVERESGPSCGHQHRTVTGAGRCLERNADVVALRARQRRGMDVMCWIPIRVASYDTDGMERSMTLFETEALEALWFPDVCA